MRLFTFLRQYSSRAVGLAVLTGMVSGAASALLMSIMNRVLADTSLQNNAVAAAFAGTTLTVMLASLVSRLLLLRISTNATFEMRMSLCRKILTTPLWKVELHGTGKLVPALTEDILAVSNTLAEFPVLCINCAIIAACVVYLVWLSPILASLFVAVFVLGVIFHELIARRTRPHLAKGREEWDRLSHLYHGLILGNKELKLHRERRLAFLNDELRTSALSMRKLSFAWHKLFAIAASYGQAFYFLVIGSILFVAPLLVTVESQVLIGFTLLTLYMSGPISSIVASIPTFQRASVSLEKIESLGLSLSDDREDAALVPPIKAGEFAELELCGVTYTYQREDDDRPFELGPLNLRLAPNETVFVVGGNGSGKSSFARVLAGLYAPTGGHIRFNGRVIRDEDRDEYRQHFSVVFSDFYLFDSLLGLGDEQAVEKAREYLERLRLGRKVTINAGRFSTLRLSQGQRKRMALLTAFLEDRPIYIFDEWAADQDPEYKKIFYHEILPDLRAQGKTLIVISHDEHYYEAADRIVRFDEGAIVDDRKVRLKVPDTRAIEA